MTTNQNVRLIAIAAGAAIIALAVESGFDLENRAAGDVLGPIMFAVFVLAVLSVIGLSVRLLVTRNRK